jgi:hypothetical protein
MTNARRRSVIAFGIALALIGCSKSNSRVSTFPASGSLFIGGQPAAGANIQLSSKDEQLSKLAPHGVVEADGAFRLTTFTTGDGAPPGHYFLIVRWPGKPKPGHELGPDRLQGRYADPKKPAREIEITSGPNELGRIELK